MGKMTNFTAADMPKGKSGGKAPKQSAADKKSPTAESEVDTALSDISDKPESEKKASQTRVAKMDNVTVQADQDEEKPAPKRASRKAADKK